MTTNYSSCAYHPQKKAITSCHRCKRPICQKDLRTLNRGSSTNSHYFDYCVLCYAAQLKTKSKTVSIATFFSFFIFISVFAVIGNDNLFNSSDLIPMSLTMFIFLIMFIGIFISMKSKLSKAQIEAKDFSSTLGDKNILLNHSSGTKDFSGFDSFSKSSQGSSLVCYQCGGYLSLKDKVCPNCGDDTSEELRAYTKR